MLLITSTPSPTAKRMVSPSVVGEVPARRRKETVPWSVTYRWSSQARPACSPETEPSTRQLPSAPSKVRVQVSGRTRPPQSAKITLRSVSGSVYIVGLEASPRSVNLTTSTPWLVARRAPWLSMARQPEAPSTMRTAPSKVVSMTM